MYKIKVTECPRRLIWCKATPGIVNRENFGLQTQTSTKSAPAGCWEVPYAGAIFSSCVTSQSTLPMLTWQGRLTQEVASVMIDIILNCFNCKAPKIPSLTSPNTGTISINESKLTFHPFYDICIYKSI